MQTTEKIPRAAFVAATPTWEKTDPVPPLQRAEIALGPTGTEMMRAPKFEPAYSEGAASVEAKAPLTPKPLEPQRTLTWGMNVQNPTVGSAEGNGVSTPSGTEGSEDPTEFDLPAFAAPEATPHPKNETKTTSSAVQHRTKPANTLLGQLAKHVRSVGNGGIAGITRLGALAKKRPAPVIAGALAGSLVLALALVGATTIASNAPPKVSRPIGSAQSRSLLPASATQPTQAPSENLRPPAKPSLSLVTVVPVAGSAVSSAQPPKRGSGPADPEVVQAVGHLAAGRHSEAERAYAKLALRTPENPAFGVLAALIKKRSEPTCSRAAAGSKACPEMKP